MFPTLFTSQQDPRLWSLRRAAVYGGGIGAVAALLRTLGVLQGPGFVAAGSGGRVSGNAFEIAAATLVFALVCVGAAALRNYLARRLIWHSRH